MASVGNMRQPEGGLRRFIRMEGNRHVRFIAARQLH